MNSIKQNKRIRFYAMLLMVFGLRGLQAQEAIPATGGDASGSGGTAGYTIGQLVYLTNTGIGGSELQGVQQPFEITFVTGIEEGKGITLKCSAFPNPVTETLILNIGGDLRGHYNVSLYDMNGERLEYKYIDGIETSIDMKNHVPATYFLKVTDNNTEVKTFKIIKK